MAAETHTATSSRRHFLRAGMVAASAAVATPVAMQVRSVEDQIADHLEAVRSLMASRNPGAWRVVMVPNADVAMVVRDR